MNNLKKLCLLNGISSDEFSSMLLETDRSKDVIVQYNNIGLEHSSKTYMIKNNVSEEYWCCLYDKCGNIIVDASFNDDLPTGMLYEFQKIMKREKNDV